MRSDELWERQGNAIHAWEPGEGGNDLETTVSRKLLGNVRGTLWNAGPCERGITPCTSPKAEFLKPPVGTREPYRNEGGSEWERGERGNAGLLPK